MKFGKAGQHFRTGVGRTLYRCVSCNTHCRVLAHYIGRTPYGVGELKFADFLQESIAE